MPKMSAKISTTSSNTWLTGWIRPSVTAPKRTGRVTSARSVFSRSSSTAFDSSTNYSLHEYARDVVYNIMDVCDAEKVALEYADAMTDTGRDVEDALFQRLRRHYDDDTIAELTMIIAWENASSRFNRAFRIPSQGFWKP